MSESANTSLESILSCSIPSVRLARRPTRPWVSSPEVSWFCEASVALHDIVSFRFF